MGCLLLEFEENLPHFNDTTVRFPDNRNVLYHATLWNIWALLCPGNAGSTTFSNCPIKSLRPSNAIRWHRSESTFTKVMTCCLMAPSHYLNWYWLLISEVLWHFSESNFTVSAQVTIYNGFEKHTFKITTKSSKGYWVKRFNLKRSNLSSSALPPMKPDGYQHKKVMS